MDSRHYRNASAVAVGLFLMAALPEASVGQVDEDTFERENYVLAPDGTLLVVTQPTDDDSGLVRRSSGGVDSTIVTPGQMLSLGTIHGIGSNPHMNASGVAAFQVEFASGPATTAIYTGVPGDIDLIADTGDTLTGSLEVCSIEPFPQINDSNQVFFGTSLFDAPAQTCAPDFVGHEDEGIKGIFRFTPPGTIDRMLLAALDNSGDEITTSDTDFVTSETTFDIIDAHLISFGGDVVADNGGVMVTAVLRPAGDVSGCMSAEDPPCERALLYLGPTAGTIQLIALEGPNSIFEGKKLKGMANNAAQAFFKAQDGDVFGIAADASVQRWTAGGGLVEVAAASGAIPGGNGTFDGFTPHVDLNDLGNGAFTAGLAIPANGASCDPDSPCHGVYYAPSGGAVVEIARTELAAAADPGGDGASSSGGFSFEEIGSVAIVDECNTVYFVAENGDTTCTAVTGGATFSGDGEATGIFAWNNGTLLPVVREGDLLADGRVTRLFVPMGEMRSSAANGRIAVRAWLDNNGNCLPDIEQTLVATVPLCIVAVTPTVTLTPTATNTLVPGVPTSTPTRTPTRTSTPTLIPGGEGEEAPAIPALGPWGLWLLVGLLALTGAFYIWRRGI